MASDSSIATPSPGESSPNRFYRTIWRWHFYAGLFVIPFLLTLAITGIIYLFKPQLDSVMYHQQIFVQPTTSMVSPSQQMAAAQQAYPQATISKFAPNIATDRSSEITLTTSEQKKLTVFVNPYTAAVLGDRDEDNNLQSIARKIHGELMIGKVGDYLVELAACWGLVLLISGLYLWLPRNKFTIWGTLIPRLGSKNKRIFWRDLHAVPGLYGALLVGFLILTGLPWSGFWGETFAQVWNQFPPAWNEAPQSVVLTGALNQHGSQVVPWAVEQMPMPQSIPAEHQHYQPVAEIKAADLGGIPAGTPVNLDSVIALAQTKNAPPGYSVSLPQSETGVYTVSAFPDDPTQEMTMHIDRYSGKILADVRWQDYALVPKAVEMGIAIHMGKYFGFANQLLMLFACLVIIILCVSGLVLWWLRRPQTFSQLGAPSLPPYIQSWKVPVVIVAVLGLAFPLVGFSLVAVLLLDYLVLSRIPALKHIFN
jgi:uncharacterized iron-regulated membrane protein